MNPTERYREALDNEMRRVVAPSASGPSQLYGMVAYHLGWADADFAPVVVDSGKRVRPTVLLLATEAQGGDWEQALPAAAAVELLHNFTLIHDDIEDRDSVRRGRPTLWSIWGVPQALNAGDTLFALSYRALLGSSARGLSPDRVTRATTCMTSAIIRITEGQCYDLGFECAEDIAEETYLTMVAGKTGALIGLAAELGAIVAGAGPETTAALRAFGEALGVAFQMQDDLLGLWGDPARTGKPVGSDILKRKKTLPIVHGMHADPTVSALLLRPDLTEADVPQALAMLEEAGSRAYVEAQAHHYHERALDALTASQGTGEAQAALFALAEALLGRRK